MPALDKTYYDAAAHLMLQTVVDSICGPCVAAGLNPRPVVMEDPLNCPCRCERVDAILTNAGEILAAVDEQSKA